MTYFVEMDEIFEKKKQLKKQLFTLDNMGIPLKTKLRNSGFVMI